MKILNKDIDVGDIILIEEKYNKKGKSDPGAFKLKATQFKKQGQVKRFQLNVDILR